MFFLLLKYFYELHSNEFEEILIQNAIIRSFICFSRKLHNYEIILCKARFNFKYAKLFYFFLFTNITKENFKSSIMSQGHRVKSSVYEHFTVNEDDKKYVCTCKVISGRESFTCGAKIDKPSKNESSISTRVFNLKHHIRNHHPDVFKIIEENDKVKISNTARSSSSSALKSKVSEASQHSFTKYFISQKVTVSMTPEQLKNNIELVVKNSLPLSVFCKPAMCGLIGELAEKFKDSLDRSNICCLIIDKTNEEKNVLKSQLKGCFIFLKMDGCTQLRIKDQC